MALSFERVALQAPGADLVLALLKPLEDEVPGLKVRSLIEENLTTPYVLARASHGAWTSDSFHDSDRRFLRRLVVDVQTFTSGVDGDSAGDALSEICWQTLNKAVVDQTVILGLGSISFLHVSSPARRVADWATSTGVSQYANLPQGYHRYQATYGIVQRPDRLNPLTAADLLALASLSS